MAENYKKVNNNILGGRFSFSLNTIEEGKRQRSGKAIHAEKLIIDRDLYKD